MNSSYKAIQCRRRGASDCEVRCLISVVRALHSHAKRTRVGLNCSVPRLSRSFFTSESHLRPHLSHTDTRLILTVHLSADKSLLMLTEISKTEVKTHQVDTLQNSRSETPNRSPLTAHTRSFPLCSNHSYQLLTCP